MPDSSSGTAMFCATVSVGSTWKAWNTKPMLAARSAARAVSSRRTMSRASRPIRIAPRSAGSSPAMQLSKVLLPTPDSPTRATISPAATVKASSSNTARAAFG